MGKSCTALLLAMLLPTLPMTVTATSEMNKVPGNPAVAEVENEYLIGTNYFSGWWKEPNSHFEDWSKGNTDWRPEHPELEPKYGWYDDKQEVMDQQILDAATNGIDFFVFDWYADRPERGEGGSYGLHNGLNFFQASPNKNRMYFMINYINHSPFDLRTLKTSGMSQTEWEAKRDLEWETITDQWIELFKDPGYLKIDGKPVIEVFNVQDFQLDFCTGTRTGLNAHELAKIPEERKILTAAVEKFKKKAVDAGFTGILLGGGLDQPGFEGEYVQAHDDGLYDFFTAYTRVPVSRVPGININYFNMIRDHHDYVWDYFAKFKKSSTDYIPIITQGWNNIMRPTQTKWTIDKTSENFNSFLREGKSYLDKFPQTNLSDGKPLKMAIIGSWNELFEGHFIVPTKVGGDAFVRQVGTVFGFNHTYLQTSLQLEKLKESVDKLEQKLGELTELKKNPFTAKIKSVDTVVDELSNTIMKNNSKHDTAQAAEKVRKNLDTIIDHISKAGLSEASINELNTLVQAVMDQRDKLLQVFFKLGIDVIASDYAPVAGQNVTLDFKSKAPFNLQEDDVEWRVIFPETWNFKDRLLNGKTKQADVAIPTYELPGTEYYLAGMLPGESDLTGNLQELKVVAKVRLKGEWISIRVSVPLSILPELEKRVVKESFDGTTNCYSIWLHNLSNRVLSGQLKISRTDGVSSSFECEQVDLAPDQRLKVPVQLVNNTSETMEAAVSFDYDDKSFNVGKAVLEPKQTLIYVTPNLDGHLISNRALQNSVTTLQVGVDKNGNEFRPILSFDIGEFNQKSVSKAIFDLTEYYYAIPGDVIIEHITPKSVLEIKDFLLPATAEKLLVKGTQTSANKNTNYKIDVTDWVNADTAQGSKYCTIRIRMLELPQGKNSIRQFRASEYTPEINSDAPCLRILGVDN